MIQIRTVKEYHAYMRGKGANMYFMMMKHEDGAEMKQGYVASGYSGEDSHHWFKTKTEAKEFIISKTNN